MIRWILLIVAIAIGLAIGYASSLTVATGTTVHALYNGGCKLLERVEKEKLITALQRREIARELYGDADICTHFTK